VFVLFVCIRARKENPALELGVCFVVAVGYLHASVHVLALIHVFSSVVECTMSINTLIQGIGSEDLETTAV
jgi:hypothetical protein